MTTHSPPKGAPDFNRLACAFAVKIAELEEDFGRGSIRDAIARNANLAPEEMDLSILNSQAAAGSDAARKVICSVLYLCGPAIGTDFSVELSGAILRLGGSSPHESILATKSLKHVQHDLGHQFFVVSRLELMAAHLSRSLESDDPNARKCAEARIQLLGLEKGPPPSTGELEEGFINAVRLGIGERTWWRWKKDIMSRPEYAFLLKMARHEIAGSDTSPEDKYTLEGDARGAVWVRQAVADTAVSKDFQEQVKAVRAAYARVKRSRATT